MIRNAYNDVVEAHAMVANMEVAVVLVIVLP